MGESRRRRDRREGAKQRAQTACRGTITPLHLSFCNIAHLNLDLSVALRTLVVWFTSPTQILLSRHVACLKPSHQLVTWHSSPLWGFLLGMLMLKPSQFLPPSSYSSSPSASLTLSRPPSIPPGIRSDWRQESEVARRRGECGSRPQCERAYMRAGRDVGRERSLLATAGHWEPQ